MGSESAEVPVRTDTALGPGVCDFSLADLTPQMREMIAAATPEWLNSLGFAEFYASPPADKVRVWPDSGGRVLRACCYRMGVWAGRFKSVHAYGPVQLTVSELQDLMLRSGAQIAMISSMGAQEIAPLRGPWYRCAITEHDEDIVIELPGSSKEYLESLGPSTRKHLPYYVRRLGREWGDSLEVAHRFGTEISMDLLSELVSLGRARMERKRITHAWNDRIREHRSLLAQQSGFLCALRFRDKLAGGTLSYLHHDQGYLVLIGHDPEYDRLNVGNVCLWLTIQRLIEMGVRRYHLLWGKSSYKFQFGGTEHPLFQVTVFRNMGAAALWHLMESARSSVRSLWHLSRAAVGRM